MFIEFITLDHARPCIAEPGKIVMVGKPSRPIDAVFPLLNALLPNVTLAPHASAGVSYNPRAGALVLRRKPGFITLLLLETRRRIEECVPLGELAAQIPRATLQELLGNYEATTSVWRASE